MSSGFLCFVSGIILMFSAFAPYKIDYIIAVASYALMFAAYVIKDKTGD